MRRLALVVAVGLVGCQGQVEGLEGDEPGLMMLDDGGFEVLDAGEPAADGGAPIVDAGEDAGSLEVDASVPEVDAGFDAGLPIDAGPASMRQVQRQLGTTDAGNGFYEYLPPNYGDGTPRPLLVFWHGLGENGNGTTELTKVLANGPPKLINQNKWSNDRPFVVLSPQHSGGGCPSSAEIQSFISFAMTAYTLDVKRLYLTGLSCGAIGSWSYLGQHLDQQIAAAVLIAGDPGSVTVNYSAWGRNQCNLGKVPIWSFHGDMDPTVNIGNDRDTMTNLLACPQPPRLDAIWTVYPGVFHDSWTRTYDGSAGHDVYAWLLQQAKP